MERPPSSSPLASIPAPPPDANDPLIGATLAERYVVERLIGAGGMARVYLARHRLIGRSVAVKILKRALADDEGLVRRFMHEGRAVGTLGHPNIVESLDMGTTPDGAPFIVLELLEGLPLSIAIERSGTLSLGRATYIAFQIAMAVGAAHERGVIHRDLKPDNIFLVQRNGLEDHVKVLDFGVSKFVDVEGSHSGHTSHGSLVGTPEYMAPEQIGGESVDRRADVYALGIILYEMLTGASPFRRTSVQETLRAVFVDDLKSLATIRPGLPAELVRVVEQATAKTRDARIGDMLELAGLLEPFMERPTPSTLASVGRTEASMNATTMPAPAPARRGTTADEVRVPSGTATLPPTPIPVTHPPTLPSRPSVMGVKTARAPTSTTRPRHRWVIGAATGASIVAIAAAASMRECQAHGTIETPSTSAQRRTSAAPQPTGSISAPLLAVPTVPAAAASAASPVIGSPSPAPSTGPSTAPSATMVTASAVARPTSTPVTRPRLVPSASTKPTDTRAAPLPILIDR